jgi:DNA-directed RNA polymerase
VRSTLVDMYSEDCLFCKFEDEIRNQLNNPAHIFEHKIPDKGTLDLEKIKESDFCFS